MAWKDYYSLLKNQSFAGQAAGANNALAAIENDSSLTNEQKALAARGAKGAKANAIAGGILTGIQGLTEIGTIAGKAAQTGDTLYYDKMLESQTPEQFATNYYDNDAVLNSFGTGLQTFDLSSKDLNPSVGQSIGTVGSAALSGAQTGLSIAGPWGAAAGALVGGGAAFIADQYGRQGNELKADSLNYQQDLNQRRFAAARNSAADQAHEYQFGQMYAQRKESGGKIEKKAMTMSEFAAEMLKKTNRLSGQPGKKIIREYCKGGVRVRFK